MKLSELVRQWRIKGALQFLLAVIPGGEPINDMLQARFGGLSDFEQAIATKVEDWAGIMTLLGGAGRPPIEGCTLLEIGTGWHPTLPVCFLLAGVGRVHSVDLNRHLSERLTLRMHDSLRGHLGRIAGLAGQPEADVAARYKAMTRAVAAGPLLPALGVDYLAPCDASYLPALPDRSVDIVYSNSVLEHVPPQQIAALFRESHRIMKDGGVMVHAVACNDHYAHFDRGISFVNYLQYSDRRWRIWNNRLQYQNRLRAPDFIRYAEESGFRILHQTRAVRPGTMEAAARMELAPQFRHYSREDLTATSVNFVAAKESRA